MNTYTHDYNIMFSVTTTQKDPWKVSEEGLTSALVQRIHNIADSETMNEAIEHVETIEHTDNSNHNTNFHILKVLGEIEWDLKFLATRSMDRGEKKDILERLSEVKEQISKIYK